MASKSGRFGTAAAVLLAVAVAAFWYWSPYWDLRDMAAAARKKDADAFNEHVDYPKLRESLKGQFSARLAAAMPKEAQDNPFAGLGAMLGMGLVNQMLDVMVRPEFVMQAMKEGKMSAPGRATADAGSGSASEKEPRWELQRKGVNKVIAYPGELDNTQNQSQRPGFVFERSGFANWKLTELRLPEVQ